MKDIAERTMESYVDFLKTQHDYYKHLTTLNTGSILITIAFVEKIFSPSVQYSIYAVPLAIAGFLASLIFSLVMMSKIHGFQQTNLDVFTVVMKFQIEKTESSQERIEKIIEAQKKVSEKSSKLTKEASRMSRWSNGSFVFGIAVLFIFASINLIFN